MAEEYKKELRVKMMDYTRQKEEEYRKKDEEFLNKERQQQAAFEQRLNNEKKQLQQTLEDNLRKTISQDFENQLVLLKNSAAETEEKLKLSRQKELEFLQREKQLRQKEEEMELAVQRKLQEQRNELTDQIRKQEAERHSIKDTEYQLKVKELEKQLDDQKKLADEMKRKAEQGSMQLQGEAQELILEELLRNYFPFDIISEVGKGVRGADCVQTVRNQFGQECGRIIYESKRTNAFSADWIEKLKKDMRSMGVDVAVIVTQCYPKGMDCFGERDGVWICSFDEVKAVSYILRDGVMKLSNLAKSQDNKGDKMHLLYDYLTSSEFSEQWKAIREGYMSMRQSIQRERDAMEKLWKAREKQLDKVLLSAAHIRGSIEGIAGSDTIQLNLTDDEDALLLE
ncbi:DUF2130 domain-containing protein [Mucilaginibacter rubeus]|uniref:DUF2130 domain-containing protein n=2 Tax=Sphingobacteriaceae TaxID=84566 RepID=A0AAE6JMU8_9SPHI|nr:DUF2130 domain-containing protein [Mucilaginibacter rubeus]QEM20738.1 DUF2130 domain-containing protein [Mucilaginibacter gossypii]QTE47017.1 DUF2130 domain-containing protein [Mucilaginibacter rubeus]QTE53618.1 DUF2130 domain-containing protein [Mucilaginibacter rubeus]QTE60119.1 DUF2130 domain-containing protein [Mucilaginibacter rubeus]